MFRSLPPHTSHHADVLKSALQSRTARIAVVGLGYVGLPMALECTQAGYSVFGIDVDPDRCEMLMRGQSYIVDVRDEELQSALASDRFQATTDTRALAEADVILICVPTPLRKSKDPDLSAILAASKAVVEHLREGQLIILESTTYPGTTEEVLLPMFAKRGLQIGGEFFLAFSPERVDPGNASFGVSDITKLVGGVTATCTDLATELYRRVLGNVAPVSSPKVAEAAKLLENTFRSVNIGLANEMALICRHLGIDVWEVIEAAATKPFGFMPHYPGPGIGGHCIPLDPHYLSWKARLSGYEPQFIRVASEINSAMPHHVVDLITEGLNDQGRCVKGSRVLLLGVAYKPNVADVRESPALEIIQLLHRRGAHLSYCDPYVPDVVVGDIHLSAEPFDPELVHAAECVVVVTHHSAFDYEAVVRAARLLIDTRNVTRPFAHLGQVRFL